MVSQMILEKDSSILGYPGEISKSMNADHHQICKYDSSQDSNYISVRNALKSLVSRFCAVGRFPTFQNPIFFTRFKIVPMTIRKCFV